MTTADVSRLRLRRYVDGGGVLEHPAFSDAWDAHGLAKPTTGGMWERADWLYGFDGYTCYVEQSRYGHVAKKATWLYACGVELPALRWGAQLDAQSTSLVSWCGNHVRNGESRPRVGKRAAAATPIEFRDVLLGMARSPVKPSLAVEEGGGSGERSLVTAHARPGEDDGETLSNKVY